MRLAQLISYLFHPLLVPTYGFMVLLNINSYIQAAIPVSLHIALYVWVFFSTCVMPASLIFVLKKRNFISDFNLSIRSERPFVILITIICYAFTYLLLAQINLPKPLISFLLGSVIMLLTSLFISILLNKISYHTLGIFGLIGGVYGLATTQFYNLSPLLAILFVVAGLIGYARLKLKVHTPLDLITGAVVGFAIEYYMLAVY